MIWILNLVVILVTVVLVVVFFLAVQVRATKHIARRAHRRSIKGHNQRSKTVSGGGP